MIPDHDSEDTDAITSTLVEKASVLPNTRMMMDDEETRIVVIDRSDANRWPDIVGDIHQLTSEYEKLAEKRDS
jgi:hypothetical protein